MNDALDPSPPAIEVVSFLNATIDLPKNDKFTSRHLGGDLYTISFNPEKKYTQGTHKEGSENELTGGNWSFDSKKDLDWRGTGKTHLDGLEEAFKRTGIPREEFKPGKWGKHLMEKLFQ